MLTLLYFHIPIPDSNLRHPLYSKKRPLSKSCGSDLFALKIHVFVNF
jgi:hypothetical protein